MKQLIAFILIVVISLLFISTASAIPVIPTAVIGDYVEIGNSDSSIRFQPDDAQNNINKDTGQPRNKIKIYVHRSLFPLTPKESLSGPAGYVGKNLAVGGNFKLSPEIEARLERARVSQQESERIRTDSPIVHDVNGEEY